MLSWILCGVLVVSNLMLLCWIFSLHRGMKEISRQFAQRLNEDTNNLIYVSSRDPRIRQLAAQLCVQLRLLRRQRHRYENGDRELKEAVTNISHDLRTPLTAISGYLELAEREEQSEALERYLEQIRSRAETMKDLTEELFRYSVSISGAELRPVPLQLGRVLEESLASAYTLLAEAGIEPVIRIPDTPIQRNLDESALSRIFGNILSNAAKYSKGDLTVCLLPDGQITFSNSAPDLTPVMAERLFDRFYTVETARHSTGIGLSIARALTEQMGGTITASCREGQLTIFLYFPESAGVEQGFQ